jgi:hexosaminidase
MEAATARMIRRLSVKTGFSLPGGPEPDAAKATLVLDCQHAGEAVQSVREDESYHLAVTPQRAHLTAPTPVGVLRGMETFLQLVERDSQGFSVPSVRIDDHPRFPWRGLLIDVARHWIPADVLKRNIDGMAAVKLNVLHLHLSDDQSFRVESRKYPLLQEKGSDGHYFTQAELKDLIAYARDRGIRVVPELDMPAHTTSWFVGYPQYASAPGPYPLDRRLYDLHDPTLDPTREEVYTFLDGLLGEVAGLFPDAYFHVGGDEVTGRHWNANPRIVAFMKDHSMKSDDDLQTYFTLRVRAIAQKHGKQIIIWHKTQTPGIPADVLMDYWGQGAGELADTVRAGNAAIVSSGYYLDLIRSAEFHYRNDPLGDDAASLTPEQQTRVLGGEACAWSEWMTPENIDSRLWPRLAAIAERFWSPQDVRDVDSMYGRLAVVSNHLRSLGLTHVSNYQLMLERLAGTSDVDSLRTLADVLEPVKNGGREQYHYTTLTPLNRLVDAVRPESDTARIFARQVKQGRENQDTIRRQLQVWRDCRKALTPLLMQSVLLHEDVPLAEDLSAVAQSGLEALGYLDAGNPAPQAWWEEQTVLLDLAAKPHAEMLLMIVNPVRTLMEAARRGSW